MIIAKDTPLQNIQIFSPRWHDRKVLIAKFRVGFHNRIVFDEKKSPTLKGKWYMSGEKIKSYPLESNGKIPCFAVPVEDLQPLEYKPDKKHNVHFDGDTAVIVEDGWEPHQETLFEVES